MGHMHKSKAKQNESFKWKPVNSARFIYNSMVLLETERKWNNSILILINLMETLCNAKADFY